jgi:phytoene dehydrogenase-like protein
MTSHHESIDVVVLGEGLGGLVAANLLVQSHLHVLILKEEDYRSIYPKEGYRFAPFSNFRERRVPSHLIQKISSHLSLPQLPEPSHQLGSFQIILPQARIDLFPRGPLFDREIKREFPKEVDKIKTLYDSIVQKKESLMRKKMEEGEALFPLFPSHSLWRRLKGFMWKKREGLNKRFSSFSKEFREYLKLQIFAKGNFLSEQVDFSLASYLLLSEEGFSGISSEKMKEILFKKFIDSGGRALGLEGLEEVERKGRDGFHLLLRSEERAIHSRFLLLNLPLHPISERFNFFQQNLSRWIQRIKPSFLILPLFIGIREKGLPVGMGDLLVSIFDLERTYENGNLLYLSLSPRGEESQAPEGRRALLVEGLMATHAWDSSSLDLFQKGVISHLKHLIPFFEDFIEFVDFEWTLDQVNKISYPHFIYETDFDFHWREGIVPIRVSKNLFFVGKENFPYLGVEGEILAGMKAAKEILRKVR